MPKEQAESGAPKGQHKQLKFYKGSWNPKDTKRFVAGLWEGLTNAQLASEHGTSRPTVELYVNKQIADGGLPPDMRVIRARIRGKATADASASPASFEERVQHAKESALKQQTESSKRAEALAQARHELLVETVRDAVTPLKFKAPQNVRPYTGSGKPGTEEAACLLLSDTHIGKKTDRYNIEIAMARVRRVFEALFEIVAIHRRAYPINELHVFMAGDIVDGEMIYPTHQYHVDGHMVKQIFSGVPTLVEMLAACGAMFRDVHVHCIRGNHGRGGSKMAHEESNWDNITYLVLQTATQHLKNVHWDVPLGWKQIVDVKGKKVLHYHGHQIKMTLNLPWYGITTRVARWASTEQLNDFDIAVQGHFHSSSLLQWNNKTVFTNGTTVDGDEFALEFLGLESSQSQWCFGIHPRRGLTWSYQLSPK